jgi:hypothetical protein
LKNSCRKGSSSRDQNPLAIPTTVEITKSAANVWEVAKDIDCQVNLQALTMLPERVAILQPLALMDLPSFLLGISSLLA